MITIRLFICLNLATWPKENLMAKKLCFFCFLAAKFRQIFLLEILPDFTIGFQHASKTVKES